jgi:hypothetical protein
MPIVNSAARPSSIIACAAALLCACPGDRNGGATETTDATTGGTGDASSGSSDGASTEPTGGEAARPNWHQDIAPLTAAHCGACHTSGGIAPFSMQTYAETRDWATVMAFDVGEESMPPWHAVETADCAPPLPWKHDARLTAEDKQLFQEWADLGAPEGDPALAAPLPPPPSLDLADPSATAIMQSGVTVEKVGATLDRFHCISLDPGNASDVFVTGMQVVPGNRKVLHHVLIYVDEQAESAGWPGGVKQDCGGGPGLSYGVPLVGAWVPGALPLEAPAAAGTPLPAGARFVFNVHYHATGAPETDDGTGLALRWTEQEPAAIAQFQLLGAPGLGDSLTGPMMIPAGAAGHVEEFEWVVSAGGMPFPDSIEARLWTAGAHMHKVGTGLRMWVEDRDTGAKTCLLGTPRYDYNWQRFYAYDAPLEQAIRLKAGDKIHVRCEYDNTMNNPGVVEALAEAGLDAPVDVQVGEGTLDEMCIGAIGVAVEGL